MRKIYFGAVMFTAITTACSNPKDKAATKEVGKTEQADTLCQPKQKDTLIEKMEAPSNVSLPKEFFGEWSVESDLSSCGFGFFIGVGETEGEIMLSKGTEWGGYNVKVMKNNDYYTLNFEMRSEGESWNSTFLVKMIGKNLHVSESGKSADFQKLYRCQ